MDDAKHLERIQYFIENWNHRVFAVSNRRIVQLRIRAEGLLFSKDQSDSFEVSGGIAPVWLDRRQYRDFYAYVGHSIANWYSRRDERSWFMENFILQSDQLPEIPDCRSATLYLQFLCFMLSQFTAFYENESIKKYSFPQFKQDVSYFITGDFLHAGNITADPVIKVGALQQKLDVINQSIGKKNMAVFILPTDNYARLGKEIGSLPGIMFRPVARFKDLLDIFQIRELDSQGYAKPQSSASPVADSESRKRLTLWKRILTWSVVLLGLTIVKLCITAIEIYLENSRGSG